MNMDFYKAIEQRRSIYALGKTKIKSEAKIVEIITFALKHVPSAFNSQSTRIVVLFNKESEKFWKITQGALKKVAPPKVFENTKKKIAEFNAGFATILFFEDQEVVKKLMTQFELYKDNFPLWSHQTNGMHQFAIWTALSGEGLGASLQHYNPLVDEEVKKTWKMPSSWNLLAQMPVGSVESPAPEKSYDPIEERLLVFGKNE